MSNKIIKLCHIGIGGQKGWVYSVDGIVGALPASQYKDPTKILIDVARRDKNEDNPNRKYEKRNAKV